MSAASVRTSGRREQFAGFAQGGREQKRTWLGAEAGCFQVFVEELFELMVHGELFLFGDGRLPRNERNRGRFAESL
jgi:hypothetical protein